MSIPHAAVAQGRAPADFTGRWKLVEQSTSAPRRRSSIGQFEEPVTITQSGSQLTIRVETTDSTGVYTYDVSGSPTATHGTAVPNALTTSRWEGAVLVTTGHRLFSTADKTRLFGFSERRALTNGGRRMTVVTRIDMFPSDLVRTSAYEREP